MGSLVEKICPNAGSPRVTFSLKSMMVISMILRIFLVLYGEWQDSHMVVRYTDVDYLVFSDAASLMASGRSPYERSTYRYSPLLAILLVPNTLVHRSWGKFIFSAADLLVGYFIHVILRKRAVPEVSCLYSVAVWLFNPFTFTIGTRGNFAFVAFNKVITAQYFVWFFCLLPLILPWSKMKFRWQGIRCILLWMVAQLHWLFWGYLLEFKGKNVLTQLWLASIMFFVANTYVLLMVISYHNFAPLFLPTQLQDSTYHWKDKGN